MIHCINILFRSVALTIIMLVVMPLSVEADSITVVTTTNLNLRDKKNSRTGKIITVIPKGDTLVITDYVIGDWCTTTYKGKTGYVFGEYLKIINYNQHTWLDDLEPYEEPKIEGAAKWFLWISNAIIYILIGGATIIAIFVGGMFILAFILELLAPVTSWVVRILLLPTTFTNFLQRKLAKPWTIFYKHNKESDTTNAKLRKIFPLLQIPLYILLTPLRLYNAFVYNMLIHVPFELFNYFIEIFMPNDPKEGDNDAVRWIFLLPWRILKYPIWHGSLTFIESIVWTFIDTFVPALTLYHGTLEDVARIIVQSPDRYQNYSYNDVGIWRVGCGNFAGDGIYFAPLRSTSEHYAREGALIVCRVSLGRTLDLGIAPQRVYYACGRANAHIATEWGLKNNYTTGEWWRKDTGWWEYCMYDWQNRYNYSWRIRPLYVIRLKDNCIQRIPGGMAHWLFRKLVIKDIATTLKI